MPDDATDPRLDDLTDRLRAVERAVTDADTAVADLDDAAAVHERLDDLRADVDELAERLDAVDATVQSLHGYVGELDAVNDRVERRADAARAAVDRLEARRQPSSAYGGDAVDDGARADVAADARSDKADAAARKRPAADDPERTNAAPETNATVAAFGETGPNTASDPSDGDDSLLDRVRESL